MKSSAEEIFRQNGGQLRMSEALDKGISRYSLYKLRDKGIIESVTRGFYRLADLPSISDPDLVTVSLRYPKSVVCLISALSFYNITTQIPHEVHVAISHKSRKPSLDWPPTRSYKFSDASFSAGITEHNIDGVNVRVYSAEKTLADCFKFRNKVGKDVLLEALKFYKSRMRWDLDKLWEYGKICRVKKIMLPYLEAIFFPE
jgi:predicted transcriptional regulator of viral defense system